MGNYILAYVSKSRLSVKHFVDYFLPPGPEFVIFSTSTGRPVLPLIITKATTCCVYQPRRNLLEGGNKYLYLQDVKVPVAPGAWWILH